MVQSDQPEPASVPEPEVIWSALKREWTEDDILHAWRNFMFVRQVDDECTMFIGPALNAVLLEIGVIDSQEGPLIIHAMEARAKFLPQSESPRKGR